MTDQDFDVLNTAWPGEWQRTGDSAVLFLGGFWGVRVCVWRTPESWHLDAVFNERATTIAWGRDLAEVVVKARGVLRGHLLAMLGRVNRRPPLDDASAEPVLVLVTTGQTLSIAAQTLQDADWLMRQWPGVWQLREGRAGFWRDCQGTSLGECCVIIDGGVLRCAFTTADGRGGEFTIGAGDAAGLQRHRAALERSDMPGDGWVGCEVSDG